MKATLAALLIALATPAAAQAPACTSSDKAMKLLEEHRMHFVAQKPGKDGSVFKIYQAYSGEYVLVAVSPDGTQVCLLERGIAEPSYEA